MLSEHALVAKLKCSLAPISKALTNLARNGLIKIISRVGTMVKTVSNTDLHDAEEMWSQLAASTIAYYPAHGGVKELKEVVSRMKSAKGPEAHNIVLDEAGKFFVELFKQTGSNFKGDIAKKGFELMRVGERLHKKPLLAQALPDKFAALADALERKKTSALSSQMEAVKQFQSTVTDLVGIEMLAELARANGKSR